MDDLVKRLRDRNVCSLAHNSCRNDMACEQAAARIEELEAKLAKSEAEKFTVGTLTMKHVFCPSGLTNVSDMQAVFDATERGFEAIEAQVRAADALAEQVQRVKDFRYDPNIGIELNRLEESLTAYRATKEGGA